MQYHCCYADDTQIYLIVERDGSKKLELCVAEVAAWLTKKLLKLNTEKSEAIVFSPAKQRDSLPVDVYITIAGHRIQPSSCVRSLGVQFDSNLKMEHQIANTVKSCYYQITNIGRIRPHLTEESCKILGKNVRPALRLWGESPEGHLLTRRFGSSVAIWLRN